MLDFLKEILGDAYTEDIDTRVSEEVGKRFVAKSDFTAKSNELKAVQARLDDAAKTIESLQEQGKDLEAVRKEAAEYKARAQQAEKDAAQMAKEKFRMDRERLEREDSPEEIRVIIQGAEDWDG